VVDAEKGLVLTDRMTVPIDSGIFSITVADAVRVPATVIFLHPIYNIAYVSTSSQLLEY
jgi:hypothetical protein